MEVEGFPESLLIPDEGTYPECFAPVYKELLGGSGVLSPVLSPPLSSPQRQPYPQIRADWSQMLRGQGFYMAAVSIWTYSCRTPAWTEKHMLHSGICEKVWQKFRDLCADVVWCVQEPVCRCGAVCSGTFVKVWWVQGPV